MSDWATSERRAARLRPLLAEHALDALLIMTLVDVRYLTGFTGSSAAVLADGAGGRFLTDFRYEEQSEEQVGAPYERRIVTGELLDALAEELPGDGGRLGFDEKSLSVYAHRRLGEALGPDWELVGVENLVAKLREVKEKGEVERMRAAAQLADSALTEVLEQGLVGRSEREIATELDLRMRRQGAEASSFPAIVAAGDHGAMPHAEPSDRPIARDVLVTIDWGALHEGYCSDCTRTYATGDGISERQREIYELTLRAQATGLEAVAVGRTGREVDAAAREVIEAGGYGDNFGHGLGHGVGLEIHEAPRLSRVGGDAELAAGNAVTIEPGIYVPGDGGVRIEDLIVLGDEGCDVLTGLPKSLTFVQ